MMRLTPLFVLGLALAGCAGSPSPVDPPAALKEFKPTLQVVSAWESQLDTGSAGRYLSLRPAVSGEMLYASARNGWIRAHSATTGERVWTRSLGLPISTGIVDGGDLLLVGGDDEVIALDRAGEVRWRLPLGSEIITEPVRSGEVIVARTVDGALHGLSAKDGSRLWRNNDQQVPLLSLRGQGVPVTVGDVAIVGFANGRVAAFGLQDGRMVWETPVAEPRGRTELERLADVDGRIIVENGMVFVAGFHSRVAALALPTGRILWVRDISSHQGMAAAGGNLFLSDEEGNVWALSQNTGATLWRQADLRGRGLSTPTTQGDALVVGDYDGYLHWLSQDDGRFLARKRVQNSFETFPAPPSESDFPEVTTERDILAPPVVAEHMVFAVDKRGAISAFRVQTGAK